MRKFIFFAILLGSLTASADCVETDSGKDAGKKGITKWVMKNSCNGKDKTCRTIASYEKDYCLDEKTLVEFFCEKGHAKQEPIKCENGCDKAQCL